jgi:hypothetical protein
MNNFAIIYPLGVMMEVARGSIEVEVLCYKPESGGFETRRGHWMLLIYLILPAELGPEFYPASKRNGNQKQKLKRNICAE